MKRNWFWNQKWTEKWKMEYVYGRLAEDVFLFDLGPTVKVNILIFIFFFLRIISFYFYDLIFRLFLLFSHASFVFSSLLFLLRTINHLILLHSLPLSHSGQYTHHINNPHTYITHIQSPQYTYTYGTHIYIHVSHHHQSEERKHILKECH